MWQPTNYVGVAAKGDRVYCEISRVKGKERKGGKGERKGCGERRGCGGKGGNIQAGVGRRGDSEQRLD